jgi:hypothetical protein
MPQLTFAGVAGTPGDLSAREFDDPEVPVSGA